MWKKMAGWAPVSELFIARKPEQGMTSVMSKEEELSRFPGADTRKEGHRLT